MNLTVFLDICSTIGFGLSFYFIFFIDRDSIYYQARFLLYILTGIYFFVGLTNIMEHSGITAFFDPYEEYLEILFMPFFLFLMYTLIARLDLEKQLAGEVTLKKTLEMAESEQSKSNAILAAIGDGISIQDRNLKVIYQNEIHRGLIGDHLGEFCYEAYEGNKEPCQGCPVVASFEDGKVHTAERSNETDKGTLHVEITASPLISQSGEVVAGIEVVRDVTNRKRMTEEIIRGQKLESIGLLAGGIAHDFNNLLTALLGNISLAKIYAAGNDKTIAKLTAAEKASLRARDLTQQLLTFSRGGAPAMKSMIINELVRDSCNFSLYGTRVKCSFAMAEDLWAVKVDQGQLSQVVNNLVINAEQAMPQGGLLSVTTGNLSLAENNPMLLAPGRYVRLTFADQGHGIAAEDLPRIFDPFYSTKPDGSGLGLATAFSIVKNHGGHISVDSGPDDGTTFMVYLPATDDPVEVQPAKDEEVFRGTGKVLVMDDEEPVRILAGEMLQHLGYKAVLAESGDEALRLYKSAFEKNDPFVAAILDLTVPGGMGGSDTGKKLLAIDPEAKILISSGYANDPVMAFYEKHGFSGIIPKPYKIAELSKKLHELLKD